MPAPVVHFEIGSKDSAALSKFYAAVFGWTFTPLGGAQVIHTGAGGPTGMLNALGHPPETYVMVYIEVADLAAALERVTAAGGKKLVGPVPLPDGKSFAWIEDSAGNLIGLLTPAP